MCAIFYFYFFGCVFYFLAKIYFLIALGYKRHEKIHEKVLIPSYWNLMMIDI